MERDLIYLAQEDFRTIKKNMVCWDGDWYKLAPEGLETLLRAHPVTTACVYGYLAAGPRACAWEITLSEADIILSKAIEHPLFWGYVSEDTLETLKWIWGAVFPTSEPFSGSVLDIARMYSRLIDTEKTEGSLFFLRRLREVVELLPIIRGIDSWSGQILSSDF